MMWWRKPVILILFSAYDEGVAMKGRTGSAQRHRKPRCRLGSKCTEMKPLGRTIDVSVTATAFYPSADPTPSGHELSLELVALATVSFKQRRSDVISETGSMVASVVLEPNGFLHQPAVQGAFHNPSLWQDVGQLK
jgi:hypothetical protein